MPVLRFGQVHVRGRVARPEILIREIASVLTHGQGVSNPGLREESAIMTRGIVFRVCILTGLLAAVATVACTKLVDAPNDKLVGPLAFTLAGATSTIPEE